MSYQDKNVTCQECGQTFVFSADDQAYHAEKGYTNEPKRCPSCREARRGDRGGGDARSDSSKQAAGDTDGHIATNFAGHQNGQTVVHTGRSLLGRIAVQLFCHGSEEWLVVTDVNFGKIGGVE